MARLQVYDPFSTTAGVDELFRGFFAPVRRGDSEAPQAIRLDVTESEQSYIVRAEVPGVKKDDIHVTIEGNQVSIAAEVKRESEKKEGDRVIHTERYAGQQFRSFTLGRDIDRKKVLAKYAEGVLELTLPKNGAPVVEKIAIL